ncbi:FG-GAP repeat domain-containing protein [Halodurantibacterium flavum]|uniref:FG-GAP repeat domain-containing protein n=1 Tax=Halodurantibacterium flavum TaxID=1382802 RepID=A0ABW4S8G0_9RHOB
MTMRVLAALMMVLPGQLAAGAPAVPRFEDATAAAGLVAGFHGGWEYMVGGGTAAFDCSGDLLPDLFIAGGEGPATLWQNASEVGGALSFRELPLAELTGVTGAWPLDIDGDGITDLAVLRVGENLLLRGLGDCRFEHANELWGFDGGDAWSTSFAATWEPGSDWPTLAVGNYIDRTEDAFPWGSCTENWLHRPGEGARFAPPVPLLPSHCALSMLFTDWDRSGRPALRISNDREYYKGGEEQLWHLPPDGPPVAYTEAEGWQRLRIWGMGIASTDLTGDGYPDYFLTSMADNRLQTLAPQDAGLLPRYVDIAFPRGVTAHRPYFGEVLPSTAWHAQFADVNNDGRADLFIAKGNVDKMPDFAREDPNNLLLQRADRTFEEAGDRAGVASTRAGRGGILADFNADGLLDLLVVNRGASVELWRNAGPDGGPMNWIALRPRQEGGNRDAINGWIEVRTGAHVQRHEITVGGGHASGHLGWHHFGLGPQETVDVRILWPGQVEGDWQSLAANGHYLIDRADGVQRLQPGR